jgi:hypothetical protein
VPIVVDGPEQLALACDVQDVADLLRARTYAKGSVDPANPMAAVAGGELVGEFTADTRPTAAEVETFINQAAIEVRARIGQDIKDEGLLAFARNVVALRAAMAVEMSYRPEQADERSSAYDELKALYDESLASLQQALPDSSADRKGFYSIPVRSDLWGLFPTSELLP